MSDYKDLTSEVGANAVRITINRPEVFNAFRNPTVEELILAVESRFEISLPLDQAEPSTFTTLGGFAAIAAAQGTPP